VIVFNGFIAAAAAVIEAKTKAGIPITYWQKK